MSTTLFEALNLTVGDLESIGVQPDGRIADRFVEIEVSDEEAAALAARALEIGADQV